MGLEYVLFFLFSPQPGEVRVRRLGAGFPGPQHLRGIAPPQGLGPFILTTINLHNVCVYAAHFPAEIFKSRCCENLGIRPELKIFP